MSKHLGGIRLKTYNTYNMLCLENGAKIPQMTEVAKVKQIISLLVNFTFSIDRIVTELTLSARFRSLFITHSSCFETAKRIP